MHIQMDETIIGTKYWFNYGKMAANGCNLTSSRCERLQLLPTYFDFTP